MLEGETVVKVKALDLFNAELIESYEAHRRETGSEPWLISRLKENATADWQPLVPVRLYYGDKDTDVPPAESLYAAREMGDGVRAVSVGPYDHLEPIYMAISKIRNWFDEITRE